MQKLKRGPPYDDDPGCKYIVIEDPWPGDKTGKSRDQKYYNFLCAWVRFMLGKAHEVECVYVVNTVCAMCGYLPSRCTYRGTPTGRMLNACTYDAPTTSSATR